MLPSRTQTGETELTDLTDRALALGLALGFDRVGVSPAEPNAGTEFLREWVARGFAGEMHYLVRRLEERVDPRRVLEGARSIISVSLAQGAEVEDSRPGPTPGTVARYARGEDYHRVLGERLRAYESELRALAGRAIRTRSYVDTGPVQERAHAARAGLGWIGKNTCLIDPELGSHLFLGVVITDLPLRPSAPEPDRCGTCRACLDACPTKAFAAPYLLDATRCLSYATIEQRGGIPEAMREAQGNRVFGCDACQEVCPWNSRRRRRAAPDPLGLRARLAARPEWRRPALGWLLALDEESWRRATRRTALRRAGYRGLVRNALVAAGNSGDPTLVSALRRCAGGDDPLLADHAAWALARLSDRIVSPAR
jgi:epoxyqueuosine reductase